MSETPTTTSIKTRFLILSDTHAFDPALNPHNDAPYRPPFSKADVLLHCGDLTMVGLLEEYECALSMLESIDADLKLVIAGNHDISLDEQYYARKGRFMQSKRFDADMPQRARDMWTGERARKAGVTYLDEGTHSFVLTNGASLRVYASPYQPEFCDFAFPYNREEDRFNEAHQCSPGATPIAENPVPDWQESGGVDVVMTHGPPKGVLDMVPRTRERVGCDHLMRALRRCKPRLHCFGHIHEGWGAQKVEWVAGEELDVKTSADHVKEQRPIKVDRQRMEDEHAVHVDISASGDELRYGRETLMVNASIMSVSIDLAKVLLTALPASLRQLAATNIPAVSSILWSEFLDNNKPDWFTALPPNIQSYLIVQYGPSSAWPTSAPTSSSSLASTTVDSSTTAESTTVGTSTSTSAAAASSTSEPDSPPESNSGLSEGAKIGIGLGVPLGVIALLAVILPLCIACRKKKNKKPSGYEPPPSPGFMPHGAFQEKSTSYQEYRRPLNRAQSWDQDDDWMQPVAADRPQQTTNANIPSTAHPSTIVGPPLVHTHSSTRARGRRTSHNSLHSVAEVTEPDEEHPSHNTHGRSLRRSSIPLQPQVLPPTPIDTSVRRKPLPTTQQLPGPPQQPSSPVSPVTDRGSFGHFSLLRPAVLQQDHSNSNSNSSSSGVGATLSSPEDSRRSSENTVPTEPGSPISPSHHEHSLSDPFFTTTAQPADSYHHRASDPFTNSHEYVEDYGPEYQHGYSNSSSYGNGGYVDVDDGLYGGHRSLDQYPVVPEKSERRNSKGALKGGMTEWPLKDWPLKGLGSMGRGRRERSPQWDRVYEA
ncbi:hypothetical protein E8E13_003043 [Curvularia kusanoi]|uniref:Calcineurin-like phosphoesterase domain-containing protein n=1 Tax=Curvularia kusanoi TaxID=90978 RepID=A0A9P4W6R0_CURKU|nr:hypothetical protein E8E13_003043 [Curvularia kusanoi]